MRLGQDNLIHDNNPAASSAGIYWPIDGRWKMPIPQGQGRFSKRFPSLPWCLQCRNLEEMVRV